MLGLPPLAGTKRPTSWMSELGVTAGPCAVRDLARGSASGRATAPTPRRARARAAGACSSPAHAPRRTWPLPGRRALPAPAPRRAARGCLRGCAGCPAPGRERRAARPRGRVRMGWPVSRAWSLLGNDGSNGCTAGWGSGEEGGHGWSFPAGGRVRAWGGDRVGSPRVTALGDSDESQAGWPFGKASRKPQPSVQHW